jgi:hypothetical protein
VEGPVFNLMRAQYQVAANNVIRFDVQPNWDGTIPLRVSHTHSCCPMGWGTIYVLELERQVGDVAIYRVVNQRSEKP